MSGPRPRFSWLKLRATSHPSEDPERVEKALAFACGLPEDVFEQALTRNPMESHHGAPHWMLECNFTRSKEIRAILARLLELCHDVVGQSLDARMDDSGVLYIRLDKQACYQGELSFGSFDDPISVRVKVEVHPFRRQGALEAWANWLGVPVPTSTRDDDESE